MTVPPPAADRAASWDELDALLRRAGTRPAKLGPDGVLRLGALYRAAAADLAAARRRPPGDPVVARLEDLVARGRQAVYADDGRRASVRRFVARTYWRQVAERPRALLLAALLLLVTAVAAALWASADPDAALGLVPGDFRGATEPVGDTGMTSDEAATFSSQVLTNNIQVTFLAFAAGITAGIGTALLLAYNGLILGALTGTTVAAGNGAAFVEFVAAHGVIELSCIVVGAAAGLRIAWALVCPGTRTRGEALAQEARPAVGVVIGTIPWLVLAGLIEGFVTRRGFGLTGGLVVGFGVAAVYWALVWRLGRPHPATAAPAPSL